MSSLLNPVRSLPSQIKALHATIKNPVEALPEAVYHERIVERRLMRQHIVYVCAPDLIRDALVTRSHALDKGEGLRRAIGPGLGQGLLTAEGSHWRWQRQALAPVFRANATAAFLPAMTRATLGCVLDLARQGGVVAIEQIMMRLTGRIIIETMLSDPEAVDADAMADGLAVFLHQTRWSLLGDLLGTPEWMPHPGKARGLAAARALRREAMAQISRRRAAMAHGTPSGFSTQESTPQSDGASPLPDDLLARLLAARDPETGRMMSDEEIIDNLLTFLTAGHETTALALAWTFDRLGRHPEIARSVQAEIDAVLGAGNVKGTGGDALAMEQVQKLTLTRAVLRESMRLTPPAPMIVREVSEPFELEGVQLHRGTRLIVPICALHRHRSLWSAPEIFDPSRFMSQPDGKEKQIDRFAYLPFGAGQRICIGASFAETEALVVMALMLRHVTLTPMLRETPPGRMEITMRPARPLLMAVTARNQGASVAQGLKPPDQP